MVGLNWKRRRSHPMSVCPSSNSKSILLVDDDERLTAILQNYLELNEYVVHTAHTGEDALRFCDHHVPDLVFLDVRMPGMGGLEVLRRLRQAHPDLQAVVVTYVDEETIRQEAATLGVKEYLLKPVNFEDLKSLLCKTA
jgi:two-component system, response regulator, stage 0 sporulation protein F